MTPVVGLIFFMIAIVGFLYVGVGFLDSMGQASHVYEDVSDQVTVNASDLPETVQVSPVTYSVKENSETFSQGSETLSKPENYSVISYSNGEFNITDVDGSGEVTLDVEYKDEVSSEVTGDIKATGEIFKGYSEINFIMPLLILAAIIFWALNS